MAILMASPKAAQISLKERLQRNKLPCAIVEFSVTTESALKKIEDSNTLVSIANAKASKHLIRQAVQKLYDIDVAKVNTRVGPNGEKKAYVRLSPDYDTLDSANKIGFIETDFLELHETSGAALEDQLPDPPGLLLTRCCTQAQAAMMPSLCYQSRLPLALLIPSRVYFQRTE
ncbi:60S ribosomal protein L23a-like [Leopardus geoffroyi]|uniref:60S ribosomal protein L23a-like n=1 Tax=Leopardus geoffroyi TaxID=46844 RepID=UPI001E260656|nr:60S ribosomal protein L23a-like [Leopardus geoffroyi]